VAVTAATAPGGGGVAVAVATDAFVSSPRAASPSIRRTYAGVLDRLAAACGMALDLAPGLPDVSAGSRRHARHHDMRSRGPGTGPDCRCQAKARFRTYHCRSAYG
jgi:hypothetical protein